MCASVRPRDRGVAKVFNTQRAAVLPSAEGVFQDFGVCALGMRGSRQRSGGVKAACIRPRLVSFRVVRVDAPDWDVCLVVWHHGRSRSSTRARGVCGGCESRCSKNRVPPKQLETNRGLAGASGPIFVFPNAHPRMARHTLLFVCSGLFSGGEHSPPFVARRGRATGFSVRERGPRRIEALRDALFRRRWRAGGDASAHDDD